MTSDTDCFRRLAAGAHCGEAAPAQAGLRTVSATVSEVLMKTSHNAAQGALMLSVTVRSRDHALTAGTRSRADMPRGDAARIRAYAVGLVDDARATGETGMTVRAGDVREALELDYRKALINICQVLGTRKLQGEAGVGTGGEARAQSGPQLGFRVQAPRRQGIAPDAGGGLARAPRPL